MDRRTFRFEDEEYLQQKREWWVCYINGGGGDGGFGSGDAPGGKSKGTGDRGTREGRSDPEGTDTGGFGYGGSALSGRGGVAVAPGAKDAAKETPSAIAGLLGLSTADRQRNFNANAAAQAAEMAGNRGGGGDFRMDLAAAAAAQPKPEPAPAPVVAAPAPKPKPAPRPAPRPAPAPAPAPEPAFDPSAYMAEIQARYDEQLKAVAEQLAAGEEARQKQLDELIKKTEDKKKKIKKPRKYGLLSLLSGSELGIVNTLGTSTTPTVS